jgi:hypothetical protein
VAAAISVILGLFALKFCGGEKRIEMIRNSRMVLFLKGIEGGSLKVLGVTYQIICTAAVSLDVKVILLFCISSV